MPIHRMCLSVQWPKRHRQQFSAWRAAGEQTLLGVDEFLKAGRRIPLGLFAKPWGSLGRGDEECRNAMVLGGFATCGRCRRAARGRRRGGLGWVRGCLRSDLCQCPKIWAILAAWRLRGSRVVAEVKVKENGEAWEEYFRCGYRGRGSLEHCSRAGFSEDSWQSRAVCKYWIRVRPR